MVTISQIEEQIMTLPDGARAELACYILRSLPTAYSDDDGGVAEAMRRDAEMNADPSACLTYDEFKRSLAR